MTKRDRMASPCPDLNFFVTHHSTTFLGVSQKPRRSESLSLLSYCGMISSRLESLLFTAHGAFTCLSGVILFEETLYQKSSDGETLRDLWEDDEVDGEVKEGGRSKDRLRRSF